MAAGLLGLATYAPPGRLSVDEVRRHWGSAGPPGVRTVAVAGFDEDTVTMAVEALDAVLSATGRMAEDLDALYFATCSAPYAEHSVAVEVARALGVRREAQLVDLGGSLRGGVGALRLAADGIEAGRASLAA